MNTYIQLRMFFQSRRNELTIRELRKIIKDTEEVKKLQVFRKEVEDCEDLILDVRVFIENLIQKKKVEREFEAKRDEQRLKFLEGKTIRQIEELKQNPVSNILELKEDDFKVGDLWRKVEKDLYRRTLVYFKGNRTQTSNALGVSIRTLRNRINDWKREGDGFDYSLLVHANAKVAQNSMRF